jgi:hypothetical protein
MNVFRWTPLSALFLFILAVSPLQAELSPAYRNLKETLKQGKTPDTTVVGDLPPPATPREHWLRSRVERDIDTVLERLRDAVNGTDRASRRRNYFKHWMEIALLLSPDRVSRSFFQDVMTSIEREGSGDPALWFRAGQLARHVEMNQQALTYFQSIPKTSRYYARGLILMASIHLDADRLSEASQSLERYFVSPVRTDRTRYWLVQGRYFQRRGADSEAYIAYSHVINHYSRSLDRREAERRIAELPLPPALYPGAETREAEPPIRSDGSQEETEVTGGLTIQAGSFLKKQLARDHRRALERLTDFKIVLRESELDGRVYHRVRIVGIPSRDRANEVISNLESSGYDAFVVSP